MPKCPGCNSEVAAEVRFCPNCGTRIPHNAPSPSAATVILPPAQQPPPSAATVILPPAQQPPPSAATVILPPADQATTGATITTPPVRPPAADATMIVQPEYVPPGSPGGMLPPVPAAPSARSNNLLLIIGGAIGVLVILALIAVFAIRQFGGGASTRPTSTAPTTPAAPNTGAFSQILLEDSLAAAGTNRLTEGQTEIGTFAFEKESYSISIPEPRRIGWSQLNAFYGDAAIEVDAIIEGDQTNAAALIFHYQDDGNFYVFNITGDGRYGLELYAKGELKTLVDLTTSPAIKRGQLNRMRLETAGDRIRMFANGQLLRDITNTTFTKGDIGLAANTFDQGGSTVRFKNLVVRGPK